MLYTHNGGGGHAPKGGVIVGDLLAGTEKEYKGGQFLPQTTPPLNPKQKKAQKTVLRRLSEDLEQEVKKTDIIAVLQKEKQICFLIQTSPKATANWILDFRYQLDTEIAASAFESLKVSREEYNNILLNR